MKPFSTFDFRLKARNKSMRGFPFKSFSNNRKSAIQNPKWAGIFAIVFTLVSGGAGARAQQPGKLPRIGFQSDSPFASIAGRIEGFRQGLRELGYVEGKAIVIEWGSAEDTFERLPA